MRSQLALVAAVAVLPLGACDRERGPEARATLVDASSSLDPARAAFNAHRGEARFVAVLSPT